jgi:hypothetical protein
MDEKSTKLAAALGEILETIRIEHQRRPFRAPGPRLDGVFRLMDLPGEEELYIQSPIATALRAGVRDFGRVIAETMSLGEMKAIAEGAVGPEGPGRRNKASIIDQSWDGLTDVNGAIWAR